MINLQASKEKEKTIYTLIMKPKTTLINSSIPKMNKLKKILQSLITLLILEMTEINQQKKFLMSLEQLIQKKRKPIKSISAFK